MSRRAIDPESPEGKQVLELLRQTTARLETFQDLLRQVLGDSIRCFHPRATSLDHVPEPPDLYTIVQTMARSASTMTSAILDQSIADIIKGGQLDVCKRIHSLELHLFADIQALNDSLNQESHENTIHQALTRSESARAAIYQFHEVLTTENMFLAQEEALRDLRGTDRNFNQHVQDCIDMAFRELDMASGDGCTMFLRGIQKAAFERKYTSFLDQVKAELNELTTIYMNQILPLCSGKKKRKN